MSHPRARLAALLLAGLISMAARAPAAREREAIREAMPAVSARMSSSLHLHLASNVIVPQSRSWHVPRPRQAVVAITGVKVGVVILEQAATTTMDVSLSNPSGRIQEAELVVPVPDGAVVRGFTFQGSAAEPTARLLPAAEARRTYEAIVAKVRDPALLEFAGCNLVRSSVFPVPARGTQRVRLTYEHLLRADGDRYDYVLPRTESLDYRVPWSISVRIKSKREVSTVYSPSHKIETTRPAGKAGILSAKLSADAATAPGSFRLSYLLDGDGVSASLMAYPDPAAKGGYFLLLAGVPASFKEAAAAERIKREVTLVLDRSGSMRGEKLEQVREAALQVVEGLDDGEYFNIMAYNEFVESFAPAPVVKSAKTIVAARRYLRDLKARGGTNIHDALVEALAQKPAGESLPLVLFLTDGLPTIGKTAETVIRDVAVKANPHSRRVFTFGVGVDVNTPLLQKIAVDTRATATFVLPEEDVEVKVGGVFKRLAGPVLAAPRLETVTAGGKVALRRVSETMPSRLPDLFEGDQLILLGRYSGPGPLHFRLSGNFLGRMRSFRFDFDLDGATTRNAFVPRLWASRRIGVLSDAVRQLGANGDPTRPKPNVATDPRMKELVDEIVRLSTEFGILTEYTSFLAKEGTDLSSRDRVMAEANYNFQHRAVETRYGWGSLNQEGNNDFQYNQKYMNHRNHYNDERMNRVSVSAIQQVNDLAFYQRGGRWVDSRLVGGGKSVKPKKVVEFGSPEFMKLARRLASENRQGSIALRGELLMKVDGEAVLVKAAAK